MMKNLTSALAIASIMIGSAVSAEGWIHASPGLGQHEGVYTALDGVSGIWYGCGMSSTIGFWASGFHISAGESTVSVDGVEIITGNAAYSSESGSTILSWYVAFESGSSSKEAHNALINALANGNEAIWKTPSGDSFSMDLTGSARIKSCIQFIAN